MLDDYYVIGGCLLYIIGVGYCAYKCSDYSHENKYCLNCWQIDKNDEYESINYEKI